jgi:hypothetical protein
MAHEHVVLPTPPLPPTKMNSSPSCDSSVSISAAQLRFFWNGFWKDFS